MVFYFNFIYLQKVFTTVEYSMGLEPMYWRKTLAHFLWPTGLKVYSYTLRNDYNVGNKERINNGAFRNTYILLYLFIIL